jgi:hypothetical protein
VSIAAAAAYIPLSAAAAAYIPLSAAAAAVNVSAYSEIICFAVSDLIRIEMRGISIGSPSVQKNIPETVSKTDTTLPCMR